jgi:hypothetical protein
MAKPSVNPYWDLFIGAFYQQKKQPANYLELVNSLD